MSILTRLTHRTAVRLFDERQYVTRLPGNSPDRRPAIYLTFDDGPHPDRTCRILDQFAEAGGHGTFFVIGRRVRRYPSVVRRILKEGHSVGCHTWRHWSARKLSADAYVKDVRRSRDEIQQATGQQIDLFRPPYGELMPRSLLKLIGEGFRVIHWTHDTRDFRLPSVPELESRFQQRSLEDGDIVLMHDDRCVTSYGLGDCLRVWGTAAHFQPVPMNEFDSSPVQASSPEFSPAPPGAPVLAASGDADSWRSP